LQSPRKAGGWTAGRVASLREVAMKAALDPMEQEIVELVASLGEGRGFTPLGERPLYRRLLDLLAQHPRVFIEGEAPAPVAVVREEPRLVVGGEGDAHRLAVFLGRHRVPEGAWSLRGAGHLVLPVPEEGRWLHGWLDPVASVIVDAALRQ